MQTNKKWIFLLSFDVTLDVNVSFVHWNYKWLCLIALRA